MIPTLAATAVALAALEGGGGSLTDIDFTLTVATLVLFGLFALVLGKFAWGPLLAIVDSREKSVRDNVEGAQKAQADAQALLVRRQEELAAAAREREEMLARAQKEAWARPATMPKPSWSGRSSRSSRKRTRRFRSCGRRWPIWPSRPPDASCSRL
jgi:hypothetical protein